MENITIVTGYEDELKSVKTEILKHEADFIHSRHTYPNGLVLEFKNSLSGIEVIPNKPLEEISPGVYRPVI